MSAAKASHRARSTPPVEGEARGLGYGQRTEGSGPNHRSCAVVRLILAARPVTERGMQKSGYMAMSDHETIRALIDPVVDAHPKIIDPINHPASGWVMKRAIGRMVLDRL